jgi:hypothetical protein
MRAVLNPTLLKIILAFALFLLSSYLWRIYVIARISDTFPWGFPLQFYVGWGPCPPGQICSESNFFFLILDFVFWYFVSGFVVSRISNIRT